MKYFLIYLKGVLMGAADLVPGVSGGTIALVTGIYSELLDSINAISWKSLKSIRQEGVFGVWKRINGNFLLAVFGGIVTSILLFSRILEWLIINEPIGLWSFFFGLLVASILYLAKQHLSSTISNIIPMILGAIIAFGLTQLGGTPKEASLGYLFLCGFIGISAMLLPGLSGAYILFILGVYQMIISYVRQAQDLIINFDYDTFIKIISVLGVFIAGIVVGIKVFSKILSTLLKKYPQKTIAILIGLMAGALQKVWPWQNKLSSGAENTIEKTVAVLPQNFEGVSHDLVKAIILMVLGFILLFLLENRKIIIKS